MPGVVPQQRLEFDRAAKQFAARPGDTEAIATMMSLACEAEHPTLRRWAAQWLEKNVNVVVATEEQGSNDAAPAKAECSQG